MAVYFVPVLGEIRMGVEAIRGRNLITGEKLGTLDRILGALPALPLLTKGGKIVLRGASITVSSIGERASLIFGMARRAGRDPLQVLALAEQLEKVSGSIGTLRGARNALQEGRALTAAQQGALDELNHALEEFNKTSGSEVSAGKAQHTPAFSEADRARWKEQDITDIRERAEANKASAKQKANAAEVQAEEVSEELVDEAADVNRMSLRQLRAAAIKEAQAHPAAPGRTEAPPPAATGSVKGRAPGKRSDPAWRQYTVMLKRETHLAATDILRRQDNGDVSELLQSPLEQWVERQRKT